MAQFRIKLELNKGRHGIPLQRLANIAKEAEKFLEMFSQDVKLEKNGWIADNFENGSLMYDVNYVGESEPHNIAVAHKAFEQITDIKTTPDELDFGIRKETFWQFAQIANHIEADDYIGIGLYKGEDVPEIKELSKERSLEIERQIAQRVVEFGGIQGEITALIKGSNHLWINDFATNNRVVCTFKGEMYSQVWQLLKSQDTVVNVEGWITKDNGKVIDFVIEKISSAVVYQEGDLEKLFGCDPNFTGELSTEEYVAKLRDEESENYLS
ncbi:MAG: hypothetical protein H0U50_02565 [Pyrinomonadaceae bacterium]|nr:hypothetical protein [Pyrinomonadaceae bacterium]